MTMLIRLAIVVACVQYEASNSHAFPLNRNSFRPIRSLGNAARSPRWLLPLSMLSDERVQYLRDRAAQLREQAREIRSTLPVEPPTIPSTELPLKPVSEWEVSTDCEGVGYRLHLDIGREPGTWMDPLWGASGKRIEAALDIFFCSENLASEARREKMVKDNFGGKSSAVYQLESAKSARLRNGFDRMKCSGGGYRVDTASDGKTLRFFVQVEGKEGADYGDISIPKGDLYFSLPCFGQGVSQLSSREGLISVRQIGWHTGFRRKESRIVGIFRAAPINKANKLNL